MGNKCYSSKKEKKETNSQNQIPMRNRNENILSHNNMGNSIYQNGRNLDNFLQSKTNPNFNFPEVTENVYIGTGLKRIKGYISNISKEDLIKKRKEFWETRIEGNPEIWNFLREICENNDSDDKDCTAFLQANDIIPYKNCINVTYDGAGILYEIPNYCIQEPLVYIENNDIIKEKRELKNITFYVKKETQIIQIINDNYLKVEDLKKMISKKFNCQIENVRMFFLGKEMENDKEIWYYNVEDQSTITLMIS